MTSLTVPEFDALVPTSVRLEPSPDERMDSPVTADPGAQFSELEADARTEWFSFRHQWGHAWCPNRFDH